MKTKNIYADPTVDFAFKRIFGTERFKAITGIGGRYSLHYRTVDEASGHRLPSSPEYHFFDLDAFKKTSKGMTDETDYWLSLLTGSKEMDGMPDWARGNKAFEAYFEASARANFTPEETIQYEKDMMTERDRINSINYARWEGVQEGIQEGIQEGMRQKQDEIARAFKAKGLTRRQSRHARGFPHKKSRLFSTDLTEGYSNLPLFTLIVNAFQ